MLFRSAIAKYLLRDESLYHESKHPIYIIAYDSRHNSRSFVFVAARALADRGIEVPAARARPQGPGQGGGGAPQLALGLRPGPQLLGEGGVIFLANSLPIEATFPKTFLTGSLSMTST